MATVHIVLGTIAPAARDGALNIAASRIEGAETITSSVTSQPTTLEAPQGDGRLFWSITTDGDIWVSFGAEPVAVAESGWLILAGQTREFAAMAGDLVAVIDV